MGYRGVTGSSTGSEQRVRACAKCASIRACACCACAHLRVRVHLCVFACPSVYACLCERMFVCLCASIELHLRARVCCERVRAPRGCMRPATAWRRLAVIIARPAPRVGGRARVVAVRCHRPGSRALAAGVTWTCRTASAEWAARWFHTSVVDAAGAIYVIGGNYGNTNFHDVWASTDGGARAGLGREGNGQGGTRGGTRWVQ